MWWLIAVALALGLAAMATEQFGASVWLLAAGAGSLAAIGWAVYNNSPNSRPTEAEGSPVDLASAGLAGLSVAVTFILLAGVVGVFVDQDRIDTRALDECIDGTRLLTGASYREAHGACLKAQRR
jgi:hypothetical protein